MAEEEKRSARLLDIVMMKQWLKSMMITVRHLGESDGKDTFVRWVQVMLKGKMLSDYGRRVVRDIVVQTPEYVDAMGVYLEIMGKKKDKHGPIGIVE